MVYSRSRFRRRRFRRPRSYRKVGRKLGYRRRFGRRYGRGFKRRSRTVWIWRKIYDDNVSMNDNHAWAAGVPVWSTMTQISDLTSLQNMYTWYKMDKVVLKVGIAGGSQAQIGPVRDVGSGAIQTGKSDYPWVGIYTDYAVSPSISTANMLLEESSAYVAPLKPGVLHTRTCRPKFLTAVYRTSVAQDYQAKTGWLDIHSNQHVPHYSFRWDYDTVMSTDWSSQQIKVQVWAKVGLRGFDNGMGRHLRDVHF